MNIRKMIYTGELLLAAISLPFSCIEESESQIQGKGPNQFRLPELIDNYTLAAFDAKPSTAALVKVFRDVNSDAELKKPASFQFTLSQDLLDEYNETNETEFEMLPESVYTLGNTDGNTVSFAAEEFAKDITLTLDPTTLDFAKSYALPFVFSNPASGYGLSATSAFAIVQVSVKNQYDGVYQSTGHFTHPTSPRDINREKTLSTRGANVVETELADLGPRIMRITVNADNSLSIDETGSPSPVGATLVDGDPVYNNRYDPDTQTFYLKYNYSAGSRLITEAIRRK